ncbi:hypothetical protein H6G00_13915 [Leptolyngbya sp. FACHB-541]|uniref:hypothetical protein n=1 Tax=Leptolyngbya sp. FACHB-541 TaxID=2692810 RepID=UPI0016863BFA|nr:hypothetical protein [Leptolyngbya sp. FACHB-541]MBD1997711.1 hypothetical protein [Leptolyngbya sp. FACHB-541]
MTENPVTVKKALQNQWLFESLSTPEDNDQNWSWEQDFAEISPSDGKQNKSTLFETPLAPEVRNLVSHYSSTRDLFEAPLRSDVDYMAATEGVEIRLRQNLFTGRESHDQKEILKLADQPTPGTRYEALVRRRFGNLGGKLKLKTTESDAWRNEQEGGSLVKTPVEITIHRKWNSRKRLQITEALLTKHRVTVITPSRNRDSAMVSLRSIGGQVKASLRRRHNKTSNLTVTLVLT